MIGITKFEFFDRKIEKELFKDNEIPEILRNHNIHLWILSHYFPNFVVIDKQNCKDLKGHPDFKLINHITGEIIFVEFKNLGDGLRKDQLEFIYKHEKDNRCYVIFYERLSNEYEVTNFQKIVNNSLSSI